jgi:HNH endonuclease
MPSAPFAMPTEPHVRRHGPSGYLHYQTYKDWLRDEFHFRCVYCQHREKWDRLGWRIFHVDHIIPQSVDKSKTLLYDNLVYSCGSCNGFKLDKVLPDPCRVAYGEYYRFDPDGTVTPLSDVGELYIEVLGLAEPHLVDYRKKVFKMFGELEELIAELGAAEVMEELEELLGYPADIPDLRGKKEKHNTKPEGKEQCYYARLERGEIPRFYYYCIQ